MENIDKIYELLNNIKTTEKNQIYIDNIRNLLDEGQYLEALKEMKELKEKEEQEEIMKKEKEIQENEKEENKEQGKFPKELQNEKLERIYIGLLLNNPKLISKYYFLFDLNMFEDDELLNIYKSVLYNEGSRYSSEKAKDGYNFSKDTEKVYELKNKLKKEAKAEDYNIEKIYSELRKLFIIRKSYVETPEEELQEKIIEVVDYELFHKMSYEEVEDTIEQIKVTQKFKQSVLSDDLVSFLESGESELANGLSYPFPIITEVFKGIRKGETMAFAMPSNSGKSRLTTNLAAYTALVHKKKVLVISNEM